MEFFIIYSLKVGWLQEVKNGGSKVTDEYGKLQPDSSWM